MPLANLIAQLEKIGRMLNRWGAELRLTAGAAAILLVLDVLALSDLFFRFGRIGRLVSWGVLVVLGVALCERIYRVLCRRPTPETVAVSVERTFPQLDNHLINHLLFASARTLDPFISMYLKMAIPHWDGLDFRAMKDRSTLRKAQLVLVAVVVLSLIPCIPAGQAWPVALWRVLNPFSAVAPVSLTHILKVTPGNVSVLQGNNVTVSCQVEGKNGHTVWLDIRPADGVQKTFNLGTLKGRGKESFSHALFKVTTDTKYHFRAGDAYSPDWNTITMRPPLAFSSITVKVVPPAYMGLAARQYDGQSTNIDIPAGSMVELRVTCNQPVSQMGLAGIGQPMPFAESRGASNWTASVSVTNGSAFMLTTVAPNGDKAEATVGFRLIPDAPPVLAIKYPRQPVVLMPGGAPSIEFTATDDFGNDEITIEESGIGGDASQTKVLKTYKWITSRNREFTTLWQGDIRKAAESGSLTLRVVAKDNRPGMRNVTVSPALVFSMDAASVAAQKQQEQVKKTLDDLNKVIALQRENIERTKQCQVGLVTATAEQWGDAAVRQEAIRDIVKQLLDKGDGRSLGNLLIPVRKLYAMELTEVVAVLRGIPVAREEKAKPGMVARALSMEEKILRQLTFAEMAAAQAKVDSQNSALTGILDGIITREDKVIKSTVQCATQRVAVASAITDEQDGLGSDVTEFIKTCRATAQLLSGDDKDYAAFLESVAVQCEQGKIAGVMLLAAEQLEKNEPREALLHERDAYDKLAAVRKKFDEVKAQAEKEMNQELVETIESSREKLEKLKALEKKLIAEMDAVEAHRDKSDKQTDKMEEDFEEIQKNIKDAMLQIPKDLDIFAHLNVGNEMVEDIHAIFEEVTQVKGSEKDIEGPVKEMAVIKREYMAEAMEKAKERIDDFESWLKNAPDDKKIMAENLDKKELPEGIALTPLQTETEDIIGDLLKQDKEAQQKTDDGAMTGDVPDMQMGGPVTEGDTTTFSAKGKSGNEAPEHKEQDGRSNVGRQGMSGGETAAGSGTIGKGDDNIEARRTQDPTQAGQVKVDGQADTKATGGGKLGSGKADDMGMGGGETRMDSTEAGSMADFLAMMAKRTDTTYIQASMKGLRADSLKTAAHHIRQASDAVSKGAPIGQVKELKRKAVAELRIAQTELGLGSDASLDGRSSTSVLNDIMEASPDEAPPKYRDLVSEYYKKLNESL